MISEYEKNVVIFYEQSEKGKTPSKYETKNSSNIIFQPQKITLNIMITKITNQNRIIKEIIKPIKRTLIILSFFIFSFFSFLY